MSARQLLDQLLQSGQNLVQGAASRASEATQGGGNGSFLKGLGGGALGAGALGLLMGSKKARKVGGKLAVYGGVAAVGVLAYRAYDQWQRKQAGGTPPQGVAAVPAALPQPQTVDRLPPAQVEQHASAILTAMIGAAKADGHIGPDERQLLEQELTRLSGDAADRGWLEAELARPVDPAVVARAAQTPEMAAEMYLASVLVVDEESFMERAYLDELARQLRLAPDLKQQLEAQAATV